MSNNIKDQQEFKSLKGLTQHINSIPTADIAAKLGLKFHKTGNSLQGECPSGHVSKHGNCFSINTDKGYWRCFSCKKGGDNISLVELALKFNFVEAIKWITTQFSITHSVDFITDKQPELTEEEKKKSDYFI
ncbi:MAG: CHC2 zinc finger domain-containing protein [Ignavibacteriaceae bacterium]|nr:CHC2 zinc finger domain-containing protein [Ignavibacteriaceae bacterium]